MIPFNRYPFFASHKKSHTRQGSASAGTVSLVECGLVDLICSFHRSGSSNERHYQIQSEFRGLLRRRYWHDTLLIPMSSLIVAFHCWPCNWSPFQTTCVRLLQNPDLAPRTDLIVLTETISKEQLSLGIVQSCSVLLFLNDEVGP